MSRKGLGFLHAVAVGLGNIIGMDIFIPAGSVINASDPGALVAFNKDTSGTPDLRELETC